MAAEAAMEGKKGKKKGGLRTMPFIFANEVAEKLAVVGFSTNMLTYLTQQMHMPLAKAATTLTNFGGTSAMTPLIGAYLADACIGRFWTIAGASVVYQVGMALLTVSAALPQFRPAPCKATEAAGGGSGACEQALPWQLAVLYVSLFLNAVGAGGYRPCIVAFGADQFDESQTAERARTWGFFNWYYFCNGASQLVAVTAVVYVQDNVGWGWGLGVPAFCMGVSVVAFVGGYPMYRRLDAILLSSPRSIRPSCSFLVSDHRLRSSCSWSAGGGIGPSIEMGRRSSPPLLLLVAAVLALAARTAEGRFVVEKNSLRVTSPAALRGVYECAIGNFGMPQYGGTMHGVVVYPKANSKACKPFSDFGLSFNPKAGGLPVFLLVDRGDCYFTTKGWNAQTAGAAAVLVADDRVEPLITMDTPESSGKEHLENITVPSALVSKRFGDDLKTALENGDMVNVLLDWRESLPHPDERVEYEFWTNSNDECGAKCDMQMNFVRDFRGVAQVLEQRGYTQFAPHYITWYCPEAFVLSTQCRSQCINHGRYCAPDPEQDFTTGYDGKDVVVQNLIQICLFKVANESRKPWLWWDYVHDFAIRCPMKEKKYTRDCANGVIKSLGMDIDKINKCVGDPDADEDNPVLKAEQDAQIGHGSRGDVTILPTFVVNNRQYRGKLDKRAVLRAICSGFEETTEPDICLTQDIQTNQCLENNGGCWLDKNTNFTACKDTFRGRVCECPIVNGVKFVGDGYTHCEASGVGRCQINNGGCWKETRNGKSVSACSNEQTKGCKCPQGFKGDGIHGCEDVDECKERLFCQCKDCNCENTWGSYECGCDGSNMLYMREHDTCISKVATSSVGWGFLWVIFFGLGFAGVGAYAVYKYRLRSYMDSEIRAIMAQYMPLENQETSSHQWHVEHADI